jgi:diguanylate cyclase (GGDEF)-like protein
MYLEILMHMGLSVIFVGWDSGFQITIIGMTLVMFYAEYLCKTLIRGNPHAMLLSIIGGCVYLGSLVYTNIFPPQYTLPENITFLLNIMWGVSVFGTEITCLQFFVYMTTKSEAVLADQAPTDKLTGLYNRRGYDRIAKSIDISHTVMLLADGDKFKEVNDNFGHETGDAVLKRIANALKEHFRSHDYVCRIGGDEFAVLIEADNCDIEDMIRHKIELINNRLMNVAEGEATVSISVGVAFGTENDNIDDLFNKADRALYSVKRSGGCGVAFSS